MNRNNSSYDSVIEPDAPQTEASPASFDLRDYLERLERWKWLALGVFVIVVGLTLLNVMRIPPLYQARATMIFSTVDQTSIFRRELGMLWPTRPAIANHIEMINSRSMAEHVAARLPDTMGLKAGQLQGMVSTRSLKNTDLIELTARAGSPDAAITIANAYVEVYRDFDLQLIRGDISTVLVFLDEQTEEFGARLDSAERTMARFKESFGLASLDVETENLIKQYSMLSSQLEQTTVDDRAREARLAQIRAQLEQEGAGMADRIEVSASPMVASLRTTLNRLEVERVNLMTRGFDDSSERVRQLEFRIDTTRSRLRQETQTLIAQQGFSDDPVGRMGGLFYAVLDLETEQAVSQARQRALKNVVRTYESSLGRLPETERKLAGLTRDVEIGRRLFELMASRREEARIQEMGRTPSVRIVDLAHSARQVQPNIPNSISMGLLLALALALGSAFAADYLTTAIRTPRELERRGFRILSTIPKLPHNRAMKSDSGESFSSHLITHATSEEASAAEAFRMLRTTLELAGVNKPHQVIAVTSPGPGEGKTTVSVNLAAVLAQAGARVLLVDGDLRHPMLHRAFGRPRKPGLTDVVLSRNRIEDAVFPTTIDRLHCLPAGKIPPSAADLLNAPATRDLVKSLAADYDCVVIDTPPVLIASDTPVIGSMADVTLMVVRMGRTTRDALEHAQNEMSNTPSELPGLVVNAMDPGSRYGRYYYYYKYSYKYKYSHRDQEPEEVTENSERQEA